MCAPNLEAHHRPGKPAKQGPSPAQITSKLTDFGRVLESFGEFWEGGHLLGFAAMAMVPSGGGDEGAGGSAWTDSGDGINDLSQGAENPWSMGVPNHPTFCLFKGVADGFAGGLMGSVFGFGNGLTIWVFLVCHVGQCDDAFGLGLSSFWWQVWVRLDFRVYVLEGLGDSGGFRGRFLM